MTHMELKPPRHVETPSAPRMRIQALSSGAVDARTLGQGRRKYGPTSPQVQR